MTREEALKDLKHFRDHVYWDGMSEEALDMAIQALKQLTSYEQTINRLVKAITMTDPRPKAHWNMINNFVAGEYRPYEYVCSECGFRISMCRGLSQDRGHNLFCQHCGADMR